MEKYAIIIAGGVFLLIILTIFLLGRYGSKVLKDRDLISRAIRYGGGENSLFKSDLAADLESEGMVSDFKALLNVMGHGKKNEQTGVFTEVPKRFQLAGIYSLLHIRIFNFVQFSMLALIPGLGFLFLVLTRRNFTFNFGLVVTGLAIICYFLPSLWLQLRSFFRKKRIERFFPDSIDLLVVCVESGMGLDSAIYRVSQEMTVTSPDLALEFKILSLELKTGKARAECLKILPKG